MKNDPITNTPPVLVQEDVLPPMPSQSEDKTPLSGVPQDVINPSSVVNSSSSAPENDIKIDTVMPAVVTSGPKKKFAGGKVIATILGLFLLVGGLGAGIFLVGQNQNIAEKAGGCAPGDLTSPGCLDERCTYLTGPECGGANAPWCSQEFASDCGGWNPPGNPQCDWSQVNCPPGTTVDYNQEVSSFCGKITYCTGPGTAQTKGECGDCRWIPDCYTNPRTGVETCQEDIWSCTKQLIKTYKCVSPPTTPPTIAPTPTAPAITASCQNIKAYSSTWTELNATQLTALRPGNTVNFCVIGVATGGSFDKAKFKINGVEQAETTTKRPGGQDFCQTYTIPATTIKFFVSATVHHVTLGWK